MSKSSLTPSVYLKCSIPSDVTSSFVRGRCFVTINDSVFQGSTPWRHAVSLVKILEGSNQKILIKFTDGGTDYRHTLESVRLATICLFMEMNLDMIVAGRCAPGQSYTNPAERIMSLLNLGLQNCALERSVMDNDNESQAKKCGSMKEIREHPSLKRPWLEALEPVKSIITDRFCRLEFNGRPVEVMDTLPDIEVNLLKRHAKANFPGLDPHKITKVTAAKSAEYLRWKEAHCRERHYTFQIRKCKDPACCIPPTSDASDLEWLPDPVLPEDSVHYMKYNEVKEMETQDGRPSLKNVKPPKKKTVKPKKAGPSTRVPKVSSKRATITEPEPESGGEGTSGAERPAALDVPAAREGDSEEDDDTTNAIPLTTQNARAVVNCVECEKPRVVYSRHKLTDRQSVTLVMLVTSYDYTCGAPLCPPGHQLTKTLAVRRSMTCQTNVELTYYGAVLGPIDLCAHCAAPKADPHNNLKQHFKTVLPVCSDCTKAGKTPVTARPYGKK